MRKLYFTLFAAVTFSAGWCQDFHLTQYDAAALNLNPALTGRFDGQHRVHLHYRNQWSAIATRPFTTGLASYDRAFEKWSFGGQFANFQAGAGRYMVNSLLLSASYNVALDKSSAHQLSMGIQAGGAQKSLNFNNLTFGNQYSELNGGGFDPSIANGELGGRESFFIPDVNFGMLYYFAEEQHLLNPFIGVSLFHLNRPKESFYDQDNKLPMRFVVHGGTKVNLTDRIQLLPKVMFMGEKKAEEITTTLLLHYYLPNSDAFLLFGPTYRNRDAALFEAGLKYGNFIYRVSYDINTSTLRPATNGRGGFELSVTFINKKINPNPVKTCPIL
jgi:type IX secretion system PorP/SprF family membrane protein